MSAQDSKPVAPTRVVVVDFDMSFVHLVGFFIKAAAAIPAAIVVFIIMAILGVIFGGIFGGLGHWPR